MPTLGVSMLLMGNTVSADNLMDRLHLGTELGGMTSTERRISEYDASLSKMDGSADTANPYLGKVLHRTHDCGFNPSSDHNLFLQRSRDGVTLYRERGVTEYSNKYNMFQRIVSFLPGGGMGADGGKPVIAMFLQSRQVFLIYRVYEAKDGRATFLCYYNSQSKIGGEQRTLQERVFTLKGYKLQSGYKITEGGINDRAVNIGLIDPATKLEAETPMDIFAGGGAGGMFDTVAGGPARPGSGSNPDSDWERNPPHPDNIAYGENQVEGKAKGKTDILQSIMEPVMFGAKIGMGAYMLKEMFKKDKKKDDDEWSSGYGYGGGMGMGYGGGMGYGMGMDYGGGYVMGGGMPGMNPGMYPGMYPGMMPGMQPGMMPGMMPPGMPPMQQPYYPGVYPGTMPGGSYPGMGPMPGPDYTQPMPGGYPGANPMYPPVQPMPGGYPGADPYGQPQFGQPQTCPPLCGQQPPVANPPQGQPNYGYTPIQPYAPAGSTSVAPIGAPMAPTSSSGTSGMIPVITQNDNTYLSTTL
jgi:hypothetical protein